ncbi:hypothetical protein [Nocardioides bigeumensis]|uniref:Uncharacterized protein n=1 Tax=Nocardioides bigeumensis TaxID=433657 RepID=A0ABN2YC63_9ACTN
MTTRRPAGRRGDDLHAERVVWRRPRSQTGSGAADVPALLGFKTDDFMVELETALAARPSTLTSHLAAREHWSTSQPPMFAIPAAPTVPATGDLKLFQPAHGRFYLVAAHLCCRRYGFPDRGLTAKESVGFVIRRVEKTGTSAVDPANPATYTELAWVPSGNAGSWQPVTTRLALAPGEELLPLTPTVHTADGRKSRLHTGLVPVGAREKYEARSKAARAEASATDPVANPRRALLDGTVIEAVRQIAGFGGSTPPADNDVIEMLQWALLDLVDFITGVAGGSVATVVDTHLGGSAAGSQPAFTTWAEVVKLVAAERATLLARGAPSPTLAGHLGRVRTLNLVGLLIGLENYRDTVPAPPVPAGPVLAEPDPVKGLLYVARCVYQRADCRLPRPEWVSPPTKAFRLASFFDPDAPGRPIQISLPIDTSQGGLRSFPRNVSVLVSKQLRAQIAQVKKLDDIGGKQSFDLGMLCTLSLPIITICALILLMVVVSILNIVFFWMPLFKICLPKPGGD